MEANLKEKLPQEGTANHGESLSGLSTAECNPAVLSPGRPSYSGGGTTLPNTRNAKPSSSVTPASSTQKKLVQQAFHPSLFINRQRTNSLGSFPMQQIEPGNNNESTEPCPPPWQRIPAIRGVKRKKTSQTPSPPQKIETSNRYSALPIDLTEEEPKQKKASKPPPIILYGIDDVNKLTELLLTATERDTFTYKIVNRNQLRINCGDVAVHKKLITLIRENGLIGHTFNRKEDRCFRIVIRNLHPSTPLEVIREEIEKTGNIVTGEIINAKYGPEKKPTSTFFVNLMPNAQNKAAKDLKYIYNQVVVIEDPRKRRSIVQCQRCQQYGHSKNHCMRPFRCVKCTEPHKTSDCPKRDRNTPAQCVLCNGAHPANYKGCQVYKEISARKATNAYKSRSAKNKEQPHDPIKGQDQPKTAYKPRDMRNQQASYSDAVKYTEPSNKDDCKWTSTTLSPSLENILLKQSEKFEIILQQMGTLMGLISTLVEKLSK